GRPPVTQVTNGVELTALVVEPVRHLVTDDGAHTTVVHRVVGRRVEKGGLENARGKGDVVEGRVVRGVDRRRRHTPLGALHRLADALQVRSEERRVGREDG